MSKRGPPPQPTRLRLLRGNPGKRSINDREPQPQPRSPSCPAWLRPEVKKIWRQTVGALREMRILTGVDRDALMAYCLTVAWLKSQIEFLDTHGEVYAVRDEKGNVTHMKQYPHVRTALQLLQVLRCYQQEFGMTPSARTRVREIPNFLRDPEDEKFFGPH